MEDPNGSEFSDGSGGCQEELENVDGLANLCIGKIGHVANGLGCLEVNHLALVPQPLIQQLHHWFPQARVVFCKFCRQSHKHDSGGRALDRTSSAVLLHHLHQSHAVVRAHLVEQSNGMILCHVICVGSSQIV